MRAKVIDSNIVGIATEYELIGDDWVQNPTEEMLIAAGYKYIIIPEIKEFQHLGEIYFDELLDSFTYNIVQEEIPAVYQKKYKFTVKTEQLLTDENLKPRADVMIERINGKLPNAPAWLIDGENSIIGFDEILQQDALNLRYGLNIITFEKTENGYVEVDYSSLPIE